MAQQLELFKEIKSNGIDVNEAPKNFIPVLKKDVITPNVCHSCDARRLCVDNKDNWCLNNSCMSFKRNDGMGVIFIYNNQD